MAKKLIVKKLDLGSGDRRQDDTGWVYCDLYRTSKLSDSDIIYDASLIDEVIEQGSVDQLRATHLLEHFSHRKTLDILRRWYSIMSKGGQLYLEVPNFAFHVQLLLDGRDEEAVRYCFGGQLDEGDFHKTAFTKGTIYRYLELVGFKNIQVTDNTTLLVTAIK